jgi:hypothetical protein
MPLPMDAVILSDNTARLSGDKAVLPEGTADLSGSRQRIGYSPALTHIAIQEQLDGKAVDWLEKVSDEQY